MLKQSRERKGTFLYFVCCLVDYLSFTMLLMCFSNVNFVLCRYVHGLLHRMQRVDAFL